MDHHLVELAQGGDRDAFAVLVRAIGDRLYAVAFRVLRDSELAQDAYQEAMIAAWRQLPLLRDPERFEAWVQRILVHACYAESRKRTRWAANVTALDLDIDIGIETPHAIHDRERLEVAFRALNVDHRAVVVLHHYLGLPLTEIAATLGIPAGTARSRLHYATQALRKALDAADALGAPKEHVA